MLTDALKQHLKRHLRTASIQFTSLSGGDINDVYHVKTDSSSYVIKVNDANKFPGMFNAEAEGLQKLENTKSFTIPKVLHVGEVENRSFLLLEFIPSGTKKSDFWIEFGERLAKLHKKSASYFGFEEDNYIGSLPQHNQKCTSATEFYISQRLEPQFKMAHECGYSFNNLTSFYKNLENIIPNESSALIHGDLWSGNFMVDADGNPCLIDPAISYAPREMDIAMMHLFGGFSSELFHVYNEKFPLQPEWKSRIDLWQLYYLLVHLNLFGTSYLPSVKRIVERFS
ncbi:fructosamine kinase family protein [Galbibacter mesophilus]|uniref:fructosamine kinase family protein n=1 Tax=Galbibacter mesophilus TaxID=379069 RepID=UPI00191D5994|nr:fructosamine kinase family protein [Galbibacter mesophilus]MCM5664328.1 fructosamine kinase family protein [Galbibacter mesophilus]